MRRMRFNLGGKKFIQDRNPLIDILQKFEECKRCKSCKQCGQCEFSGPNCLQWNECWRQIQIFSIHFQTDAPANDVKQFFVIQKADYRIVLKDEINLDYKPKTNTAMNVNVSEKVDLLQFPVTTTFSSLAEN